MNSHSFATGDTTTLAGFTSTNGFDLLNGQSGTITKTSTVFTMSLKPSTLKTILKMQPILLLQMQVIVIML